MTILGKILILFNLLAATALVYVASVDWAARNKWAYAVFLDETMLKGLPLDEKEEDALQNIPFVDKYSETTLKTLFGSHGEPVSTQKAEVERLQGKIAEELNALPEPERRTRWVALFEGLANNTAERAAIREHGNDPKVSWSELEREFNDLFQEAVRPRTDDEGKMMPAPTADPATPTPVLIQTLPRDRHHAVAHLLFNVHAKGDAESVQADHLRLQIVIGVTSFNEEAKHQAQVYREMADQVTLMTLGDRSGFEVDYKEGLDDLRDRAEAIGSRNLDLTVQAKLKGEHTKLKDDRQADVDKAKEALSKARKLTFDALKQQAAEEDTLFKAQRILGGAKEENERLERILRSMEKAKVDTKVQP